MLRGARQRTNNDFANAPDQRQIGWALNLGTAAE